MSEPPTPELPPKIAALLREMQAAGWTGSLTLHLVGGEIRKWDQRRSGAAS